MRTEKRLLFGVFTMLFFLLAGVVGTVSAAELDPAVQLRMEVRMLERINELQLTNEQIDKILPILKNAQTAYLSAEAEIEKLLKQERDLLVQRKADEAKAIAAQRQVAQQKAGLQMQTILLDLQTILTPEQKNKAGNFMFGNNAGMFCMTARRGMPGGTSNSLIIQDQPGQSGQVVVIKKPDKSAKDENYTQSSNSKVSIEISENISEQNLPVEVREILIEKWQTRLQELEGKLATATAEEKVIIEKEIAEIKVRMERLQTNNGRLSISQNPKQVRAMKDMMTQHKVVQFKGKGRNMDQMMMRGRGMGYGIDKGEMLATMIKVLEEVRKGSK